MASPRIVVTSPWKLGLFVFLLVSACGFGLIYAYFEFFGGSLDFKSTEALQNFYFVCGGVAFLGLLGYLAVVSAAQPAERVAHFGRRRRQLMKKASKIDDPTRIELEDFRDEPTLAAVLERWRRDREMADLLDDGGETAPGPAPSSGMSEDDKLRLEELGERMEQIGEEVNSLALNAALHLSRLGDEAAPLMETMDSFQAQAERIPEVAEELHRVIAGVAAAADEQAFEAPLEPSGPQIPPGLEAFSPRRPATADPRPEPAMASGPAAPAPAQTPPQTEPAEASPRPDELAEIQDEIFHHPARAPQATPAETPPGGRVYELSEFGAEECAPAPDAASGRQRVYDLNEFGAVEI